MRKLLDFRIFQNRGIHIKVLQLKQLLLIFINTQTINKSDNQFNSHFK